MIEVHPAKVSPELRALFDPGEPAGIRCVAVLEGDVPGHILTDKPDDPTWAILQEKAFGTLYLGGNVPTGVIHHAITECRQAGEVLIGFWPGDERLQLLPQAEYEGWVLDFLDRPPGQALDTYLTIPDGCHIERVDERLITQCVDGDGQIAAFGSVERALNEGFGFCLMRGDEILSEALSSPPTMGIVEMGTATREAHRGQGYATIASAHLVQACEAAGYQTYWNCNEENLPSAAIARKLGYRTEKRYKLLAWFKTS